MRNEIIRLEVGGRRPDVRFQHRAGAARGAAHSIAPIVAVGGGAGHAAACEGEAVIEIPFAAARAASFSIRHFGMEPDDFQLETVVGARSNAVATATVPPSASMI